MKRFLQYSAMALVCAAMVCFMAYAGWALFCAGPDTNGAAAYAYAQPEIEYVPDAAVPEAQDAPDVQARPRVAVADVRLQAVGQLDQQRRPGPAAIFDIPRTVEHVRV